VVGDTLQRLIEVLHEYGIAKPPPPSSDLERFAHLCRVTQAEDLITILQTWQENQQGLVNRWMKLRELESQPSVSCKSAQSAPGISVRQEEDQTSKRSTQSEPPIFDTDNALAEYLMAGPQVAQRDSSSEEDSEAETARTGPLASQHSQEENSMSPSLASLGQVSKAATETNGAMEEDTELPALNEKPSREEEGEAGSQAPQQPAPPDNQPQIAALAPLGSQHPGEEEDQVPDLPTIPPHTRSITGKRSRSPSPKAPPIPVPKRSRPSRSNSFSKP
jgi:hypothetical protein